MEYKADIKSIYCFILFFSEFGQTTPEVNSILQVGMMSVFAGGIYGGYLYSKIAYEEFMTNNTATKFTDHLDAKVCRNINPITSLYEDIVVDLCIFHSF